MATIIHQISGREVSPDEDILSISGEMHTLVGYEPDGEGSGHIVSTPKGKWGARNQERHRPHFFRLRVEGGGQ